MKLLDGSLSHLLQMICLDFVELIGKIYINFLRIYQTSCLIPEGVHFFLADVPDFHDRRRSVYTSAFLKDRNKKFS